MGGMRPVQWSQVEGLWEMLRPKVAAYWSRLPKDEVAQLGGDRTSLVRLVKRYYALEQSGAEAQVDAWVAGLPLETPTREAISPPGRTKDEQRAEGEGSGVVPGAATRT